MKIKKFIQIIATITVLIIIGACGQNKTNTDTNSQSNRDDTELKLIFAHAYSDKDYRAVGYQKWADIVNEKSDGKIKIEVHSNGTLIPLQEGYDATSTGTVDIYAQASSYISPRINEVKLFDVPGAYDPNQWIDIHEATKDLLDEIFAKHNMKYLHFDYQAEMAVITNTEEPLVDPDNWSGLKIRDAGEQFGKVISKMGGSPMTIPVGDLPTSVASGVVDGAYIGWPFIKSLRLYEVMPSISLFPTSSVIGGFLTINLDKWNELTEEQQNILIEAGNEAMPFYEELGRTSYEELIEEMESDNVNIHITNENEEAEIKQAAEEVLQEIYEELDEQGRELFDTVKQFR